MPAVGAGPIISKRAQRECQEALQQLSLLADPHAAIHSVRKHIRKLRSLLALVRNPAFDLQDMDATLRRLGVSLSDARDAHVVVEAAQRLQQLHPAPGWAAVIDVLSARRARILEQLLRRDPGLQRRAMTLRRVARQLQDQPWHALRRRDVRAGLE
ncbi:TPA: CHAD domain-containing protein, partial [Stenotrophomonas maltophilia]|nr:CHAD domain-containing protein [Stenotrophomonas maltophilia]